jgi:aryl-alcohol dehydrogenase-like predicted oxidoreductase
MKTRILGHSGIEVSNLCLGTMYLGTKQSKQESFALLDQFTDAGGTFIDTANIYAWWIDDYQGGESEIMLGSWIKERKNRNKFVIASKVGFGYGNVPRSLNHKTIEEECNKSLKRLGIDTIDLYYAHNDERTTPLEETLEAFYQLSKAGKIRQIGASNYSPWRLEEARFISKINDWIEYCCVQQRHSYIRKVHGTSFDPQITVNEDMLDYCRNRDITLLAYSVLLSGAYTNEDRTFDSNYLGTDTDNRIAALRNISKEIGVSPNQVILAWMLHSNPQVLPLIAASNPQQMEENLSALQIKLTDDQMDFLNSAGPK